MLIEFQANTGKVQRHLLKFANTSCQTTFVHYNRNISTFSYPSYAHVCQGQTDRQTDAIFIITGYPWVIVTRVPGYKIFIRPSPTQEPRHDSIILKTVVILRGCPVCIHVSGFVLKMKCLMYSTHYIDMLYFIIS